MTVMEETRNAYSILGLENIWEVISVEIWASIEGYY
jgi:hypothetical protein